MNPDITTAKDKYRRIGWFERASESAGKWIGAGRLRSLLRAFFHQLLLLRSGGGGLQSILPGGESIRILPAYRFASWNPVEYEAFKAAIRPGNVVLDIGANVGAYSVLFGRWVGPTGKVFAFEPAPESFAALRRHIGLNRLESIILPQRIAISDRNATLEFFADSFQGTNHLVSKKEAESAFSRGIQVQALTIDEFCAQNQIRPDFIKIDIEGFELAALRGARQTIRSSHGQLSLFVEMHPSAWEQIGISREDILRELDLQGLQIKSPKREWDSWTGGICLQLCSHTSAQKS
jgi:FkbM family methyltransferase